MVAEGEHGREGGFFEAGAPIVGAAAGVVVVDPGMVGASPTGEEHDVATWNVEDVARLKVACVRDGEADGG